MVLSTMERVVKKQDQKQEIDGVDVGVDCSEREDLQLHLLFQDKEDSLPDLSLDGTHADISSDPKDLQDEQNIVKETAEKNAQLEFLHTPELSTCENALVHSKQDENEKVDEDITDLSTSFTGLSTARSDSSSLTNESKESKSPNASHGMKTSTKGSLSSPTASNQVKGISPEACLVRRKSSQRTLMLYENGVNKLRNHEKNCTEKKQQSRRVSSSRTLLLYEDAFYREQKLEKKREEKALLERAKEIEALKLLEINPETPPPPPEPATEEEQTPRRKSTSRSFLLYEDAKYRELKINEKRDEQNKVKCSFSPSITKKAKRSKTNESRFLALYDNAAVVQAKLNEKREESKKVPYTFKPKINKAKIRKRPEHNNSNRTTALYENARTRKAKLDQKRDDLIRDSCTFAPKINKYSKTQLSSRRSLYPSQSTQMQTKEKLLKKREEIEMSECTFEPKRITGKKWQRNSYALKHISVYDRLHSAHCILEEKKKKLRKSMQAEELKECTFEPEILSEDKTEKLQDPRIIAIQQKSFCRRLHSQHERTQKKQQKYRDEITLEETNGFKPITGNEFVYFNQERVEELHDIGKICVKQNLVVAKDKERQHSLLKKKAEEDKIECTFQPSIDPTSEELDRKSVATDSESVASRFDRLYENALHAAKKHEDRVKKRDESITNCSNTVFSANSIASIDEIKSRNEEDFETSSLLSRGRTADPKRIESLYRNSFDIENRKEMKRKALAKTESDARSIVFSAKSIASLDDEFSTCGTSISGSTQFLKKDKVNMLHVERLYQNAFQVEFKREQKRKSLDSKAKKAQNTVFSAKTIAKYDERKRSKSLSPTKRNSRGIVDMSSHKSRNSLSSIWEHVEAMDQEYDSSLGFLSSPTNNGEEEKQSGLENQRMKLLDIDEIFESKDEPAENVDREDSGDDDLKKFHTDNKMDTNYEARDLVDLIP